MRCDEPWCSILPTTVLLILEARGIKKSQTEKRPPADVMPFNDWQEENGNSEPFFIRNQELVCSVEGVDKCCVV